MRENHQAGPLIGRFCGQNIPSLNSNLTNSHLLWIMFRTDAQGSAPGFDLYFELVHGVALTGNDGVIVSPGYPVGLLTQEQPYKWTIAVDSELFVELSFEQLELPQSSLHQGECHVYVAFYDGLNPTSATELGRYCGHNIPEPVTG